MYIKNEVRKSVQPCRRKEGRKEEGFDNGKKEWEKEEKRAGGWRK